MKTENIDYGYGFMPCEREEATKFCCNCGCGDWLPICKETDANIYRKPVTHGPDGKMWAESEWEMVKDGETVICGDYHFGLSGSWFKACAGEYTAKSDGVVYCYARKKAVKEKQIDCPPLVASCPPLCGSCCEHHNFGIPCLEAERLALVNESNGLQLRVAELEETVFSLSQENDLMSHDLKTIRQALNCDGSDMPQLFDAINKLKQLESRPQWPAPVTDRLPTKEDGEYFFGWNGKFWGCYSTKDTVKGQTWLPQPPAPIPQKSEAEIAWEIYIADMDLSVAEIQSVKPVFIAGHNAATKGGGK